MTGTAFMTPIRPGEILTEEYLAPLNITQHKLAVALGVPPRRIKSCTAPGASALIPRCG